jgi:hypothetical protein
MMVRGPVRKGEALPAGLLRCGHCGRRLLVSYNGTKGDVGRYNCCEHYEVVAPTPGTVMNRRTCASRRANFVTLRYTGCFK